MPRKIGPYSCVVPFYHAHREYGWMANTYRNYPVTIDNVTWPTTEHYFQAMKFPANEEYQSAIQNYGNKEDETLGAFPTFARKKAEEFGLQLDSNAWHGDKDQMNGRKHTVMREAIHTKIEQHPTLRQALLVLPADAIIVEATGRDSEWGDNDGKIDPATKRYGKNSLGQLWMEERRVQEHKKAGNEPSPQDLANIQQAVKKDHAAFQTLRQSTYSKQRLYDINTALIGFSSNPDDFKDKHKKNSPVDVKKQAEDIWQKQIEPRLSEGKSVGLLYAANLQQANDLIAEYNSQNNTYQISGGGQAPLFAALQALIKEKQQQSRVRILPVSTSLRGDENKSGNIVSQQNIERDLANIACHIGEGYTVLGLENPKTGRFSIGGGYSRHWNTTTYAELVESSPGIYVQYDPTNKKPSHEKKQGISQGAYVETQLRTMADQQVQKWPQYLRTAHTQGQTNIQTKSVTPPAPQSTANKKSTPPKTPPASTPVAKKNSAMTLKPKNGQPPISHWKPTPAADQNKFTSPNQPNNPPATTKTHKEPEVVAKKIQEIKRQWEDIKSGHQAPVVNSYGLINPTTSDAYLRKAANLLKTKIKTVYKDNNNEAIKPIKKEINEKKQALMEKGNFSITNWHPVDLTSDAKNNDENISIETISLAQLKNNRTATLKHKVEINDSILSFNTTIDENLQCSVELPQDSAILCNIAMNQAPDTDTVRGMCDTLGKALAQQYHETWDGKSDIIIEVDTKNHSNLSKVAEAAQQYLTNDLNVPENKIRIITLAVIPKKTPDAPVDDVSEKTQPYSNTPKIFEP